MASERTKKQALRALNGMDQIVQNEMLRRRAYISQEVVNPELAKQGAICGGHSACAIGSLYLGGGIKPSYIIQEEYIGQFITLEGTFANERADFLRHRPGLRLALGALNAAAKYLASRRGLDLRVSRIESPDAIEVLFEDHYDDKSIYQTSRSVNRVDLRRVIASAKRSIEKGTAVSRPLDL